MADLAAPILYGPGPHRASDAVRAAGSAGKAALAGLALLMAAAMLGLASPAFAHGNNCMFQAKGLAIDFGQLDPSSGATITVPVAAATLNANKAGDCSNGMNMVIDADGGQNFSGSRRMRLGATSNYIPYSLTGVPTTAQNGPGNGTYVTFTFSGVVAGTAYQTAPAGTYRDTVLITVTP